MRRTNPYGYAIGAALWAIAAQGQAQAQPLADIETEGAGGLTALYPWDRLGENVLENGSFEVAEPEGGGASAWNWRSGRTLSVTEADAQDGGKSLLVANSHMDRRSPAAIQRLELSPGWYLLSGWMKAANAGGNKDGSGGRIELSSKESRGALATTAVVSGTTDWTRVERRLLFPGGPAEVRLAAYRKPDGRIYFDAVELRPLIPPLVEGFLLYPNYRGVLFPEGPQTIRLAVDTRPELIRGAGVRIQTRLVPEAGGAPAAERSFIPREPRVVVELDAADLAPGSYLLELRAVRESSGETLSRYPDYRVVKLTEKGRERFETFVDANNRLVLNGEPRFVLGIYNTSGYSNAPSAYAADVDKIAEAPFDLYINYWLGRAPTRALTALTTMLQSRGLYYLHTVNTWHDDHERFSLFPKCRNGTPEELGEALYVGCRASELSYLRGVAGFYTADERPVSYVPPVFEQYRVLASAAVDGVTFIAQNKARELGSWRDAADVFDLHQYPIFNVPEGTSSPLETVYENTRSAVSTLAGSRPVLTVIQYFPHGSRGHWPTYDELRSMSFMAIAGGAKGLFYWSFGAKGLAWVKDPELKEEIWQRLVRVTTEVKSLEPALLLPDAVDLVEAVSEPSTIKVLAKRREGEGEGEGAGAGEAHLIAVNLSTEPTTASFRLAETLRSVTVLGEGRELALDAPGARSFSDAFAPHGVHVYRLDLSSGNLEAGRSPSVPGKEQPSQSRR